MSTTMRCNLLVLNANSSHDDVWNLLPAEWRNNVLLVHIFAAPRCSVPTIDDCSIYTMRDGVAALRSMGAT